MAEASEGLDGLKERLPDLAALITPTLLKAMNKQLLVRQPKWLPVVEHFVGLIRNVQQANPKDVQLYLSDHKKLIIKLNKQVNNAHTLTLKYVKLHHEALSLLSSMFPEAKSAQKGDSMEDGHIRSILEWSLTFGEYAGKMLEKVEIQAKLDALNDRFEEQKLKRDRVSNIKHDVETLDVTQIYRDSVERA